MEIPLWLIYTLITLLVSVPFYIKIGKSKSDDIERNFRTLMWIPGVAAFAVRMFSDMGMSGIDFTLGSRPALILVALLSPLIIETIVIISSIRLSLAFLEPSLLRFEGGNAIVGDAIRMAMGSGRQNAGKFIANIFATLTLGTLLTLVFSLVEEFGWRGFLQPQLIGAFGLTWGVVLGGFLWGVWHMPIVLAGYKFVEYPKLGAYLFMPIFTISAGIITGWLYFLSGSIWVPAIFNAATKISSMAAFAALGEAADSRRVRIVWAWLWAVFGGLALALWRVAV